MARITPKTNWVARNIPVATDFNRIERNNQQAFDEIDAEEAARIAAINAEKSARIAAINAEESARIAAINAEESARIADVNSEEAARIAADNNLQSNISSEASTRSSSDSSLQTQINARATKAVIGDNGGVGSVVSVTSTYVQVSSGVRSHTWAMPHSGIWLFVNPPIGMPSIFSGSSTTRDTQSNTGPTSCQFWRIG